MEALLKDVVSYKSIEYDLLKIKPDSRLTGTSYVNIIKAIHSLYKPIHERLSQESFSKYNSKVQVQMNNPVTYEIMFDGDDKKTTPIFCFGIPSNNSSYIKQRIQGILPQSTITFEEDYSSMFNNSYVVEYNYEKDSMMALKTTENNFLQMMLNLKNDINKGEKILFQVEMAPLSDMWKSFQDDKWDKIRQGKDVATKKGLITKGIDLIGKTVDDILEITDEVMGYKAPKKEKVVSSSSTDKKDKDVKVSSYSTSSRGKKNDDGFSVRIRSYIVCKSKIVAKSYATSIETCMRELEDDNRLIQGSVKTGNVKRGFGVRNLIPIGSNIMSCKELASIVNIPNQKLQREFKIDSVNLKQIDAPKQMMKGKILLGHLTKHGETVGVYLSENRDLTCLPLFMLTKMGGGKTTFILNICNDAIKAKHGLVLFDYIKNCATANALLEMHPECRKIVFDDWNKLCTFAFPEVPILPNDTAYDRRIKANTLAKEVKYLLNAMASDTENMSRIMSEFLTSACKIVFIHNGKTLKSVYDVLTDNESREEYISLAISQGVFDDKSFEVKKLRELDVKPQKADGVLDRFSIINEDTLFQEMMMKPYESNINFADIMNNAEPVVIMMPQDIFTSKIHKDVICTYFMSRIRLAMSRRTNFDNIAHIIVDELHQIPQTMNLVADTIAEPRKFSLQYVMSLHALSQIENKTVRDKIMGVGCNFMLLKGISHQAFEEFKSNLNGEFEFDDIINMDYQFGSLNMFMVDNAYKSFITELPPAMRDRNGKLYIA